MKGLCPAELLGKFSNDSAFNLLRNLCDIFFVTTGWFLILAKVFRSDYVAASNTAHGNTAETNELGGYVTVSEVVQIDTA